MKTFRSLPLSIGAALGMALLSSGAHGEHAAAQEAPLLAQGGPDCYAIGQQVAAQQGGTLAGASAENRGGTVVCHIVVLVPARDGERPRRVEITVPAQ
jgi:hypothetical protein